MMTTAELAAAVRERLGPVGIRFDTMGDAGADAARYAAHLAETLGYGSLWTGESVGGTDVIAESGVLLAATSRVVVGAGIANVWTRHPAVTQGAGATLGSAWPGRFILGVGVSHAEAVRGSGLRYSRPVSHMSRYLADMDASSGRGPAAGAQVPRVVAALRPAMLAVARDQADGAATYFVPPTHAPRARQILGPGRLLITEQAVVLSADPDEARRIAREHTGFYLKLSNFTRNLRALGYGDDDLSGVGSDRLVDAVVAWGTEDTVARRVREHLDGGADHVLLQPLGDVASAVSQLERLAPAVIRP